MFLWIGVILWAVTVELVPEEIPESIRYVIIESHPTTKAFHEIQEVNSENNHFDLTNAEVDAIIKSYRDTFSLYKATVNKDNKRAVYYVETFNAAKKIKDFDYTFMVNKICQKVKDTFAYYGYDFDVIIDLVDATDREVTLFLSENGETWELK